MTLREQLERDEGRRHVGYADSDGQMTIGIGHRVSTPLSDAAIDQILDDDIQAATEDCSTLPFWSTLSEARRGVLINMAFNMGFSGLLTFRRMLAHLADGEPELAAQELLDSKYAKQVGPRAHRLALQLSTDQWV